MPSIRAARATVFLVAVVMLADGHIQADQTTIASAPPPEGQEASAFDPEMPREKDTMSTGVRPPGGVVVIPLDNTGFADWNVVNPRNPLTITSGALLEFVNQTPDRTFEITTQLSLDPASSTGDDLSTTLPLLVYDALELTVDEAKSLIGQSPAEIDRAIRGPRGTFPGTDPGETLRGYEARLLAQAINDHHRFRTTLQGVLDLEEAIRELAVAAREEKEARLRVLVLPAEELKNAKDRRIRAEETVKKLMHGEKVNDPNHLSRARADLIDALDARSTELRRERLNERDPTRRLSYNALISFFDLAVFALKQQSARESLLVPLRRSLPTLNLKDCTVGEAAASCLATIQVYPNGTNSLPYEVLRLQADQSALAQLRLKFFEEEESPAKSTAFLVAEENKGKLKAPNSVSTIAAVASVAIAEDPLILDRSKTSRNCPFFCESKPYDGERRTHATGAGRVEVTQTFGNLFDGKVSFGFKEGDLGGGDSNLSVKLSQYRFNLYSQPGWTFHYGKYTFSAPTSGIAINESGEGMRLAWRNYGLAWIMKRENKEVEDNSRDHTVLIFDAANIPVKNNFIRTANLTAVYGDDRKESVEQKDQHGVEETIVSAHKYHTMGGQIGFTTPGAFYGTLGGYYSERDAREESAPCGTIFHVCDGEGEVGLLTLTKPFAVDENGKSRWTVTLSVGIGSGDDLRTPDKDEGYIGETANYAPDQIFLASFANSISTRDFIPFDPDRDSADVYHSLDVGVVGLGRGLANKRYLGFKYVDNSWSLLELLAKLPPFRIPASDIRSRSTTITVNDYRLRRPLDGRTNAGQELDLEFTIEAPRSVKITLKGAYYWRGGAVERFIHKNALSASVGISLAL